MRKLLTYKQMNDVAGYINEIDYEIIRNQTKILSDIFDNKNNDNCRPAHELGPYPKASSRSTSLS